MVFIIEIGSSNRQHLRRFFLVTDIFSISRAMRDN